MNRQTTLDLLAGHKAFLAERFGVASLALFGSTARDTATSASDVDVLVAFEGPSTAERFFGVQFYLEDLLQCPVDLVSELALRAELRPYVLKDAIHV